MNASDEVDGNICFFFVYVFRIIMTIPMNLVRTTVCAKIVMLEYTSVFNTLVKPNISAILYRPSLKHILDFLV